MCQVMKDTALSVILVHTPLRADPRDTSPVYVQGNDAVLPQAPGVRRIVGKMEERIQIRVKRINTMIVRSHPDHPGMVLVQCIELVAAGAPRICIAVQKPRKAPGRPVKSVQTAAEGADPERTLPVLHDRPDPVVAQTAGVMIVMPEVSERHLTRIKTIQTFTRADPDVAEMIARDRIDPVIGDALDVSGIVDKNGGHAGRRIEP